MRKTWILKHSISCETIVRTTLLSWLCRRNWLPLNLIFICKNKIPSPQFLPAGPELLNTSRESLVVWEVYVWSRSWRCPKLLNNKITHDCSAVMLLLCRLFTVVSFMHHHTVCLWPGVALLACSVPQQRGLGKSVVACSCWFAADEPRPQHISRARAGLSKRDSRENWSSVDGRSSHCEAPEVEFAEERSFRLLWK